MFSEYFEKKKVLKCFLLEFPSSSIECLKREMYCYPYSHDVLPIVMGPRRSDYEMVAPNGSFIHVDDFKSPKLLAEYLEKLDNDDELYNQYFLWKNTGKIVTDTRYYCRMCAMLHDEGHSPKHYEDINEWWAGPGVCER